MIGCMRKGGADGLRKVWSHIASRDREEIKLLLSSLAIIAVALVFLKLASAVSEGETQKFDEQILLSLRKAEDPGTPVGPAWLKTAALDVTSLGGATVLGLVVAAVTGFFLLQGLHRRSRHSLRAPGPTSLLTCARSGAPASRAAMRLPPPSCT